MVTCPVSCLTPRRRSGSIPALHVCCCCWRFGQVIGLMLRGLERDVFDDRRARRRRGTWLGLLSGASEQRGAALLAMSRLLSIKSNHHVVVGGGSPLSTGGLITFLSKYSSSLPTPLLSSYRFCSLLDLAQSSSISLVHGHP